MVFSGRSPRIVVSTSRVVWEYSPKSGGKSHLKLNNGERPIANKYREGKMQRTLKRELKVLEIVKREAIGTSVCARLNQPLGVGWCLSCERSLVVSAGQVPGRPWAVHFGWCACQRRLGRSRDGPEEGGQVCAACCVHLSL